MFKIQFPRSIRTSINQTSFRVSSNKTTAVRSQIQMSNEKKYWRDSKPLQNGNLELKKVRNFHHRSSSAKQRFSNILKSNIYNITFMRLHTNLGGNLWSIYDTFPLYFTFIYLLPYLSLIKAANHWRAFSLLKLK